MTAATPRNAAEWKAARKDDREWAAELCRKAGATPESSAADVRRQQVRMSVRAACDGALALGTKWTDDDVRWAIETSPAHVVGELTAMLGQATDVLDELNGRLGRATAMLNGGEAL